ncbi:MAG TPA: hypothetical protein VKY74_06555, partial [Chloroflexia bacterium]|nr:hypothetical protein [Chloroflexia bacterium]
MADAVTRQLGLLEAAGLVRSAIDVPDPEYLFRHALVQDAAYSSLLKQDRRRLHQAVGETLEHLHTPRLDDLAGELARHFQAADDTARARRYYTQAGAAALAR